MILEKKYILIEWETMKDFEDLLKDLQIFSVNISIFRYKIGEICIFIEGVFELEDEQDIEGVFWRYRKKIRILYKYAKRPNYKYGEWEEILKFPKMTYFVQEHEFSVLYFRANTRLYKTLSDAQKENKDEDISVINQEHGGRSKLLDCHF